MENTKQTNLEKFYEEIEEYIQCVPAEAENEIHKIYLRYLKLHKKELNDAYNEGRLDGFSFIHKH
jgi:hypothetical protein